MVGKNYRLQDIQLSKSSRLEATGAAATDQPADPRGSDRLFLPSSSFVRLAMSEAGTAESNGGEYRARTGDLLLAKQALSQLS